ncbi:MAG TPA: hypothetical protein VL976_03035 [Xanthobacteraceae bacterium]|nr:hypothetical protein [Xanthobacteraceae bacterium]
MAVNHALVNAENVDALIAQGGVSGEIDLLSIDIKDNEYWVWQAVTAIRPRVVVIDYDATLHPPLAISAPVSRRWCGSGAERAIAWSAVILPGPTHSSCATTSLATIFSSRPRPTSTMSRRALSSCC